MERIPTIRELPTNVKISKKAHVAFDNMTARIEAEKLYIGMPVTAYRDTVDRMNWVTDSWYEPAVIVDIRNFDILVEYSDGVVSSVGGEGRHCTPIDEA